MMQKKGYTGYREGRIRHCFSMYIIYTNMLSKQGFEELFQSQTTSEVMLIIFLTNLFLGYRIYSPS